MCRYILSGLLAISLLAPVASAQPPAADLVRSWYRQFLNREPEPRGHLAWTNRLQQGQPPDVVLAGILASDEYYLQAGSTPEEFVQKLFRDLVGRPPSPQEYRYWVNRAYMEDRHNVTSGVLLSLRGAVPR